MATSSHAGRLRSLAVRVIIATDSYTGTLTALAAADAIAQGWRRTAPADELVVRPMSDGGPGFVEVVAAALSARMVSLTVTGPLGHDVQAAFAISGDTAYVESAQACGLALVPPSERDPSQTTTFGVGQMIKAAVAEGATKIIVGLGGSATNDAGAGMLAALGATSDTSLDAGGWQLRRVTEVDLAPARAAVAGVDLVAASDVDIPLLGLRGCSRNFAEQKGASADMIAALEEALENFAAVIGPGANGRDPAVALGAGAAGGLGYGLALLGARRVPGISTVMDIVGLAELIRAADLVITGEGRFDWQSLRGKVVSGVAAVALAEAKPAIVLAGEVTVGRREYSAIGVAAAYSVATISGSVQAALEAPADRLADVAERVARTWSQDRR